MSFYKSLLLIRIKSVCNPPSVKYHEKIVTHIIIIVSHKNHRRFVHVAELFIKVTYSSNNGQHHSAK